MSIKAASIIGLIGAALSLILQLGILIAEERFIEFLYRGDVPIGRILHTFTTLTLFIFFLILLIKQK